ncbi:hypothetical protein KUCAC02_003851 [Chaenocephalus aceratus]|uniref:Uncharacterized protein n=1 Tax=Chaenocephalus aceratus TaxID=36190 RepID=A0ACB9WND8_CHAAC|nr:hypothetical protein KUCAC02_003851 [Chaenocephalus aceratus]
MSPVSLRSTLPSGKTQNRVSQVLQVQVPLNPLRKKSTAKDIGQPTFNTPQVIKKAPVPSSEEWSTKRPSDDTVSSLHSSPTVSPQGSPRKVGGVAKSHNSSQMNLSGSSSSLTSDVSTKTGTISLRSYGIGYALLPAGKVDNLSDSSHSEISSRSSICSVDSVPPPGLDDRCSSSSRTSSAALAVTTATAAAPPIAESSAASHAHVNADYNQAGTSSSSMSRGYAGRGSWTSCSSTTPTTPSRASPPPPAGPGTTASTGTRWPSPTHTWAASSTHNLAGPIAEVEAAARHTFANEDATKHHSRQSSSDLSNQSRQSWASSGSLSDTYEGNYGTKEGRAQTPPTKTVTSSTDKGLIVYCITSASKDERYRAPPPTPPGYQGLALGDLGLSDRVVVGARKYSVALQRSKLLQSPGAAGGLAEARRLAGNHHLHKQEARTAAPRQVHSRPPSICLPPQDLADSEDDEQVSAV